jgi:hypothetical protein
VDLADGRHAGKAGDHRFLERVFTPEERTIIQSSAAPDQTLWMLWAGKEAAFKTVSKARGAPPVFNHRLFEVSLFEEPSEVPGSGSSSSTVFHPAVSHRRTGLVRYQGKAHRLLVEVAGPSLHALSWASESPQVTPPHTWGLDELPGEEGDWRSTYGPRFSPREWPCVSHRASALARLAAKTALESALGVPEDALEIACDPGTPGRRIPRVYLDGVELGVDLTISHHGRLLAWAFLVD